MTRLALMFAIGFVATWLAGRVTRRVAHGKAAKAAMYMFLLSSINVVGTILYVTNQHAAPALILGNCLGTYVTVSTDAPNDPRRGDST